MIKYYIKGTFQQSMKNNKTKPQQYKGIRSPMFFKIGARKNFASPTQKPQVIKRSTQLKRDSKTGALQ